MQRVVTMDLQLLRTFLDVIDTGSFAAAADRLHVTQSAVSLRIGRLEGQLGRPLFQRGKTGVTPTPAGREFRRHAAAILRSWDQARIQVGGAEVPASALAIGAEVSLWSRLGFRWLDALAGAEPRIALRSEVDGPEALMRRVAEGTLQVALTYAPAVRSGLDCGVLMEDDLILVSPWEDAQIADLKGRYVLADWGQDFLRFHESALPDLPVPDVQMAVGTLILRYIAARPLAAYVPARAVHSYVAAGQLFPVTDAPSFAQEIWAVWRNDIDPGLRAVAQGALEATVAQAQAEVAELIDDL